MLKVEWYKLLHSKSMAFFVCFIIFGAVYLGRGLSQMGVSTVDEILVNIFIDALSIMMIYFMVCSIILLNRDYSVDIYRVFIGTGVLRWKIIVAKYIIFLLFGLFLVLLNSGIAITVITYKNDVAITQSMIGKIFMYIVPYIAILSIMFLLAIVARKMIRAIIFHTIFQIVFFMSPEKMSIIHPFNLMSMIAKNEVSNYFIVMLVMIYMIICFGISYIIFCRQEF